MKGVLNALLTKTQGRLFKVISSVMYCGMYFVLLACDVKECTMKCTFHFPASFSRLQEKIYTHSHA